MKPISIKLPESFHFSVAEEIAKRIHSAVISMHLRVTEGIWPGEPMDHTWEKQRSAESIQEIRALLRSINDPWVRRGFVLNVKALFNRLCEEKRTTRKWQDYVAGVRAAQAEHAAKMAELQAA